MRLPGATRLVVAFEDRRDGERVLDVLGKRFGRYGLELHATKTRFVDFRPNCPKGHDPDTTFDFLGFTHVWGTSRRGNRVVRQITAKDRFARAARAVHVWCKRIRHRPLSEQRERLARIIRGHCNYYGLTGNSNRLAAFHTRVVLSWRKALSRRSRKGRVSWQRMGEILVRLPLPAAKVMRSIYAT